MALVVCYPVMFNLTSISGGIMMLFCFVMSTEAWIYAFKDAKISNFF